MSIADGHQDEQTHISESKKRAKSWRSQISPNPYSKGSRLYVLMRVKCLILMQMLAADETLSEC
jgi:hypothetical protein